ncbi:MAG: type III pantothenate kinase [Myxococcota bacterium]|nr:type III pantothenate kinase [Myxococcota bacterium]
MLLAVDIGNTQTVIGVFDGEILKTHFRLSSSPNRTSYEYGVLVREVLQDCGLEIEQLSCGIISSVVPPLTEVFHTMIKDKLGQEPILVGPGVKTGMPILYDNPREVGADRIVNAVAAFQSIEDTPGGPWGLVIADFGTAITFDVVSPQGEYLGGAISPGVNISTDALFLRASKLPKVELQVPSSCIGKTTVTSMQAGILYGYVALVDGMVRRMQSELKFKTKVLATGGMAKVLCPYTETIESVDELLTLKGLLLIHQRNQR